MRGCTLAQISWILWLEPFFSEMLPQWKLARGPWAPSSTFDPPGVWELWSGWTWAGGLVFSTLLLLSQQFIWGVLVGYGRTWSPFKALLGLQLLKGNLECSMLASTVTSVLASLTCWPGQPDLQSHSMICVKGKISLRTEASTMGFWKNLCLKFNFRC